MSTLAMLGAQLAGQAMNYGMGQLFAGSNDRRQIRQQQKLQDMQIKGQKELTDYNYDKSLAMWDATNYAAQKKQIEKAGLSVGLMYGMGGGGGTTAGVNPGSVSGGQAPAGGGEIMGMQGQVLNQVAQLKLMEAQKENIEADTENKKSDSLGKLEDATNKELINALQGHLQSYGEDGKLADDMTGSIAFKKAVADLKQQQIETVFKGNEDARQKAMNIAEIGKIAEEVELLRKKGQTEMEILNNLIKEGKIKDAEIEWNKVGLTKETFGQLIIGLLKGSMGGKK